MGLISLLHSLILAHPVRSSPSRSRFFSKVVSQSKRGFVGGRQLLSGGGGRLSRVPYRCFQGKSASEGVSDRANDSFDSEDDLFVKGKDGESAGNENTVTVRQMRDFTRMLGGKDLLKAPVEDILGMADDYIQTKRDARQRRIEKKFANKNSAKSIHELGGTTHKLKEPPAASEFEPYQPKDFFRFEVIHKSRKPGSRARVGRIHTPHGIIDTPGFVPVGTNAALKAIDNNQSRNAGTQLMFCNTYHLIVHPGAETVRDAGGLHNFMNRNSPIITDSGGFQVFSLADATEEDGSELKSRRKRTSGGSLLSITEKGTKFKSYFNGSIINLTPESSVQAQKMLGSDIIIPLDELPPYHVTPERLRESVYLSHRWEARSLKEHLKNINNQAMYAVIHGGVDRELRKQSVEYLSSLPFDGFAVGGSLGKDRKEMAELLEYVMPLLPEDRPNHVLGIADTESIEATVAFGCDTFDSAYPTRIARHGTLFTSQGVIHIKLAKYKNDHGPVDPENETIPYSRAYLHHLLRAREPLFLTLASLHNLSYMNKLMANLRKKILNDEI